MRKTIMKNAKKAAAVALAVAMALTAGPVVKSDAKAKVKAPKLSVKNLALEQGDSEKLTVKKGTYKIKSITWKSKDKNIAKVTKKGKVTGVGAGTTKVTAKVVTKKTKKKTKTYNLTCTVDVIEIEPEIEPGVWYSNDPTVTDAIKEMVTTATAELTGASYKPVIWLGFMVSEDGTSTYRVLCRETTVTATPKTIYSIVEISEKAGQAAKINLVKPIEDVGPYNEVSTTPVTGGWTECTDDLGFEGNETDMKVYDAIKLQDTDGVDFKPLAKLGVNVSAGEYCVIAESQNVTPNAEVYYSIFFVNVNYGTGEVKIEKESTRHIYMSGN